MNDVIIFGTRDFAELAYFYLESDSEYSVVAFTVHHEFMNGETQFKGLPLVPFEQLPEYFPADQCLFFSPMSPSAMNQVRANVYEEAAAAGYSFASYISSKASVLSDSIGSNCFILEDNTVQPFVRIGDNVTLWSGNHIGHHSTIRDHAMITSQAVVSGRCDVGEFSYLGVNATIRDGIKLRKGTFVAMASSITADTDEWGAYRGNPAKKLRMPSYKLPL